MPLVFSPGAGSAWNGAVGDGSDCRRARPSVLPSKPNAGTRPTPSPTSTILNARSNVRIARLLGRPARMGHRAVERRTDLLGVFPQIPGCEFRLPRLPILPAPRQL